MSPASAIAPASTASSAAPRTGPDFSGQGNQAYVPEGPVGGRSSSGGGGVDYQARASEVMWSVSEMAHNLTQSAASATESWGAAVKSFLDDL